MVEAIADLAGYLLFQKIPTDIACKEMFKNVTRLEATYSNKGNKHTSIIDARQGSSMEVMVLHNKPKANKEITANVEYKLVYNMGRSFSGAGNPLPGDLTTDVTQCSDQDGEKTASGRCSTIVAYMPEGFHKATLQDIVENKGEDIVRRSKPMSSTITSFEIGKVFCSKDDRGDRIPLKSEYDNRRGCTIS
ncbi:hypothetical protein [Acerihabitans arboris]|uniref:Uncharacterized protein n=1 Tax=Acerihabitans arboris TaxID=2691583 RepID=A0A845SDV4_9GAMM|nr:hypothetical protein [Acerihabitans arboris]NDL61557.1 hypothetical protein [Acerihabitans arboris]